MHTWNKLVVRDTTRYPLPSRDSLTVAVSGLASMFIPEPSIEPVPLAEPPVLIIDNTDLTVWRVPGALVLRIGPANEIGAETIEIPAHMLASTAATLAAEAEGCSP